MAGAQHPSVTGMDERTLGRIDLILFDADYRDAKAAVEDSWRVAVLASDPRIRTAHDRARATAVGAANARRDPSAPRVPTSTTLHRVALAVALVAGVVAVALLSTPRTSALALRDVMLPAGLLAVASAALLCWLEPRRANGSLWGSRVPAGIHVGFGGLWLLRSAPWRRCRPTRAWPCSCWPAWWRSCSAGSRFAPTGPDARPASPGSPPT